MDKKSFLFGLIVGIAISGLAFVFYSNLEQPQQQAGSSTPVDMPEDEMIQAMREQISELEEQVGDNPDDVQLRTQLANFYYDMGEPENAIKHYEKVLELEPESPAVLVDCGVMYRQMGRQDKALEMFDKAIEIKPDIQPAYINSIIIYRFDLNDMEKAGEAFERFKKAFPDDPHIEIFKKELGL
ncbi:MAG: tetratricopeptide repeat protein [candidate division Zixibacteria bacterium]|nr:tetratricopeptide repeat protein [candidate division Zixibacteria bacterium]